MVTFNAWLDGGSATLIIIFSLIMGTFFLNKSKKLGLKVLTVAAFMVIFVGFLWLGPFVDFIFLLFTGKNIEPIYLYGVLSYLWIAPAVICGIYIGAEHLIPEKKWYIVFFFIILGVVFEFFLFFDTMGIFQFTTPGSGNLIDAQFILLSPGFILCSVFVYSILGLNGIGFLLRARKLEGVLRRRFFYLSITFSLFCLCAGIEGTIPVGPALVIVRLGIVVVALFLYYGLRTV